MNIDEGSEGGSHWTLFYIKDNKSFSFDSFGGSTDKFLLQKLAKPITFRNYKIDYVEHIVRTFLSSRVGIT